MSELLLLLVASVFVNNIVLTNFLGLCPFMGVSRRLQSALGMSAATAFVLTLSAGLSYGIWHTLLQPFELQFLRIIVFILVIAAVVNFTEILVRWLSPLLHQMLGIYLPLITTNCAVLGVALINLQAQRSFIESLVFGLGAALGFSLVLVLFAALRERIREADVPAAFKGAPIGLITAGLMSLAFMGFSGLVRA